MQVTEVKMHPSQLLCQQSAEASKTTRSQLPPSGAFSFYSHVKVKKSLMCAQQVDLAAHVTLPRYSVSSEGSSTT